ncbi:PREDICTED: uncharacterized protein LOC109179689 isoform X2 [Ipomoea nil]|uniref:uncharacterized protein LOC109179689 isoform X2 n=1 Tax=Ipomoea nil TaxID=35883 RepID=UPI000900B9EE|nr:PREDICTED: uncharacterized protein LOC109179689 isoform X2 [Ipomoea nil]XP_019184723.1 PREDICTED: uncharacterized protein LOC109179689 isoform X2 [Ipomoea nil]
MSKRTRSTRGAASRKKSGLEGGEAETFGFVFEDILPEQPSSSPPSPPAKASWLGHCAARRSLRSTTKCAQRIIPRPKQMNNAAAPHNLEHQTEPADDDATQVVPNATSSAAADHSTRSSNFNLTQILQLVGSNDDEEVSSAPDNFLVKVDGGYMVKPENAPLIKKIFARYGDIVKESVLQSVEYRSSFLESVCSVYQRLDSMDILSIAAGELKSMLNLVSDLELARVEIGWLRCRVEQIYEAKKSMMEAGRLKATRTKALEEMEGKKKAVADTKQELEKLQKKLKKLEDEVAIGVEMDKMNERYSNLKSKVQRFYHHPLVSDLL